RRRAAPARPPRLRACAGWRLPRASHPQANSPPPPDLPAAVGRVLSPRGQELDGAWLDLEHRGQHARVLAVDVDANRFGGRDLDSLAVHHSDLRVVFVEVLALTDPAHAAQALQDRKSTRLNSCHVKISYAV